MCAQIDAPLIFWGRETDMMKKKIPEGIVNGINLASVNIKHALESLNIWH
jgi:hypothetical protein